ncbi:hypothetical protein GCM10011344_35830 [Dokdonia pacifica]|uniref:Uncharacterized protein n=1 Tax=Dokdonia pacifica TaxID=1627892 RepID=A0A239ATX3_9FLAO|nr:hypothetical protein [Dokdonia pacifica]GGG31725.1 hypothetical protein GCM10011344_35830 [Dokdonia pacifica]SNR99010.1 hypothetical protein SAMN06265376_105130 [Dokdonia pacifica]
MKKLTNFLIIALLIGIFSCTNKKKEKAETKAAVEQIEAVESEIENVSKEIESKAEELEDSLKELDDI